MSKKLYVGLSLLLIVIGMVLTGVIDRLLAGDTVTYLKLFGGYFAIALGSWLFKSKIFDQR